MVIVNNGSSQIISRLMKNENPKAVTVTGRIYETIFKLLEEFPEGLHWSELASKIKKSDKTFHPKTVNGCIWKITEKYPDKVYKPSKGVFRLLKYNHK